MTLKKPLYQAIFVAGCTALLLLSGCAKQMGDKKLPDNMTFDQLKERAKVALDTKDYWYATAYLHRIVEEHADNLETPQYRLALGDMHLMFGKNDNDEERLKLAYECYRKFYKLNPSNEKAEYASYRAILAQFYQTLHIDCDTSIIQKAAKLCKKHLALDRFARGSFSNDVRDILYTCERLLIDKEFYVTNVYMRNEKYKSARNRLKYLRDIYGRGHADLEARLLYSEAKLDLKEKLPMDAQEKVKTLLEKYPNSEYVARAQNIIKPQKNKFDTKFLA